MSEPLGPCVDPSNLPSDSGEDPRLSENLVLHLLAHCPTCTERTKAWWSADGSGGLLQRLMSSLKDTPDRIASERRDAAHWLDRLRRLLPERQLTALTSSPRACVPAMVDLLIEESKGRLSSEITEAVRYAELACEVAERLDLHAQGEALANDYRARGLVALARAQRRAGDLRTASAKLWQAAERLEEGTGDPLERGALLEEEGELRTAQRRFVAAERVLRRAIRAYRGLGERHAIGRAQLRLATTFGQANEPERALAMLRTAAGYLEPSAEPRAILALVHNLAYHSADAGHSAQAMGYLRQAEHAYQCFARPADVVKVRWTQAKILLAEDRIEAAAELFLECQREFALLDLPYEAASVSLELAVAYARLGERAKIRDLVLRLLKIFDALDVDRETAAAVVCLREAAEADAIHLELLASVTRTLAPRSPKSP